ncbi:hypothetical protein LINPERHAP1_LOCUS38096, partial [Linum perenne]
MQSHFTCGMRSSQLSETCNSNMRHYLTPNLSLEEFFQQFSRLVENKREEELKRDFKMKTSKAFNRFEHSELTKQLAKEYTPKFFKKWLSEYEQTLAYGVLALEEKENQDVMTFNVFKQDVNGSRTDERIVTCTRDCSNIVCG